MANDKLIFTPVPSTVPFLLSDKFVSLIVGPYGSTKTTVGLMKIAYEASRVAKCSDGIRRSRCVVVRNCYDKDTELLTENGWEKFADLDPTTKVAAVHGDKIVFEVPSFHYAAPYKGKMIGLRNQAVDLLVTPDHELWLSERRGRAKQWMPYRHVKAMDVYGKGGNLRMHSFGEKKHRPLILKDHWYTKEDYDDMVYCVEVSSHVIIVRRNGRAVLCGQTRQMLHDTTIPDFLKWFPDGQAGVYLKTDSVFVLRFSDVECEVLFRGLDDTKDVRRLLSLQLTFGVMDEFREIHPDIYESLAGRVGRYPDKVLVPPRPEWGVDGRGNPIGGCVRDDGSPAKRIWGMSNPPDMDTFWEQLLNDPPSSVHVSIQPSGMSPEADWLHLLDSNYYEHLVELHANDPDWVDVYIHGKFGKSLSGKPVFRTFDPAYHVAKQPIKPIISEAHPLIIGMDFGLTPACTINQQDARGRLLTLAEAVSDGMGVYRFVRELLRPLLTNKFPGHPVMIVGDPAGAQRAQTDERSVFDILRAEGFKVIPAKTNSVAARISAVETLLSGQIDGGPRHLIDPGCTKLITALRGKYRYKVKTNGETEDKPEKNFYSHIADAHQYACLHVNDGVYGARVPWQGKREVVVTPMLAWT